MTSNYFRELNYTAANEDSLLEYRILPPHCKHVIAIAGSGSRIIPLLAKYPRYVTCADTSLVQLYITELRIEAVRTFSHSEYLYFWGYPQESSPKYDRKELFQRLNLKDTSYQYLERLFEQNNWQGLLYDGKWERTFKLLSRVNRAIVGKRGTDIFTISESKAYREYLLNSFPLNLWKIVVKILGNAAIFNALLYGGNFPQKNITESYSGFYLDAFEKLFNQGPANQNYFLQILFFGKIVYPTGLPAECAPEIFHLAKDALQKATIAYVQGDIFEQIGNLDRPADFISLSDVPSYLKGDDEQNFLQKLSSKLSPNALIVARYYLHIPNNVLYNGYDNITNLYNSEIADEKTQMYTIEVLRKNI